MGQVALYILGALGYAKEIAAYFRGLDPSRPIFFVIPGGGSENCISIEEYRTRILDNDPGESILGSGRCAIRARMLSEILPPFATFIHPTAVVYGHVGVGCVIAPNAVIGPNAIILDHVLINYNATIGHDVVIEPLTVVGPTAAVGGYCRLHEQVYIGAGALVREHLSIGRGAIVGMGAVVTKDVAENKIVVGAPAREMEARPGKRGWL